MAKGKKKENLTMEEKLERALVPREEWPYEVPGNWCWVKFSDVIELISGRDVALKECNDNGIGIPYILGASNIENNTFNVERWIENPQVISLKGDVLLSVKGTIGKIYEQKEEKINISRQIMALRSKKVVENKIIYWYLHVICDELREAGNGLIPGISRTDILNKKFPLPPIKEQKRIVEKIEKLFSKLDEAKEKVQQALDGFEERKAAILHKAFSGELTADWRKENNIDINAWKYKKLGDTSIEIIDGDRGKNYPKKDEFAENGYCIFLNAKNVTKDGFRFDSLECITKEKDELLHNGRLERGDMVMTTRGTIGNVAIYDESVPYDHLRINSGMVIYRGGEELNKQFLIWLYKSRLITDQIDRMRTGSAQPQLPIKIMNALMIPIPSIEEQFEIVKYVSNIMEKEERIKCIAENAIDQIDLMKKSILAKAFRGGLGTNNLRETDSIEFVKEIIK